MAEARRTLVKSPPELWAEISDPGCLAKHLGAFGEIRITRVEPETAVAWEGDRARGTVELEASGWGTKVRLTAETVEVEEPPAAPPEPVAVAEPEPPAAAPPENSPEPPPPAAAPTPEPLAEATPEPPGELQPPPAAPTPEPLAEATPEPAAEPEPPAFDEPTAEQPPVDGPRKRRGFFARLFGRRTELRVTTVPAPPPGPGEEPPSVDAAARVEKEAAAVGEPAAAEHPAPAEKPGAATEERAAAEHPAPVEEPRAVKEAPTIEERAAVEEPAAAAEQPARTDESSAAEEPAAGGASPPAEGAPVVEPERPGEIRVTRLADEEAAEVLNGVLDTLGAAHHRPFSR